ncbi:P-loop NTPase fold protein [Streptomyces maremycinicus]|uniref:P-loop NTPase fold protein n=1 Tax=Streptomyces maremycinicus TaxID=1679753 RepID=UPI000789857D|nr:P-loop NTPase fold protein [Streptomyces sp. NBRC 110468]
MQDDEDRELLAAGLDDDGERAAYARALKQSLTGKQAPSLLDRRPGAFRPDVLRAMRMEENVARVRRAPPYQEAAVRYEAARDRRDEAENRIALLLPRMTWDVPLAVAALSPTAPVVLWATGSGWWPAGLCVVLTALGGALWRPESRGRVRALVAFVLVLTARAGWVRAVRRRTVELTEAAARDAMPPVVRSVLSELLGDDPDCLLVATEYEGIRDHRDQRFVVDNQAMEEIHRKLDALVDGTIAVCGPRGSGKSTLLATCGGTGDLKVSVQAPASYAPLEFLTSLFVVLCETYLTDHGYGFPEFRRLSPLRTALRRLGAAVRALARSFLVGLLALGLFLVGLFAAAHGFVEQGVGALERAGDDTAERLRDALVAVLEGRRPWSALTAVVLGFLVWKYVRRWRFGGFTGVLRQVFLVPAGRLLMVLGLVTVWSPRPVIAWFEEWRHDEPAVYYVTMTVVWVLSFIAVWLVVTPFWDYVRGTTARAAALVFVLGFAAVFVDDRMRHASFGWDLSQRVALISLGAVMIRASRWRRGKREPTLARRCRDHLYRLQTVQSVTYGASGAPAGGLLSLGSTYGTSFTASPLTLPELVQQLRRTLAEVAGELRPQKRRLVVTIDEIDRLGSTAKALEFLGEIKAILGVTGVHFLISVSEDVGAAFVRRGLPGRDVADSTFDDVVHVRPCSLEESKRILGQRAAQFSEPFVALAHALSGGVPRDLIRYSREMVSLHKSTGDVELRNIAAWLVIRAMRETVDAFRAGAKDGVLPTRSTDVVFGATRRLAEFLHADCLCELDRMRGYIGRFARWEDIPGGAELRADLPADALERLEEAAAYAYFCVTLLDVFAAPGFERRRTQAHVHRPDGSLERLAVVRGELSLSPHSARRLLDDTRAAWGLPPVPAPDLPEIVETVRRSCPHHAD